MIYPIIILIIITFYWLFMSSFSQLFGKFIYRKKTNQKVVALTFDDGPNSRYTEMLLDTLKKEKIKATFFIVGECAEKYPESVKRIDNDGHTIGNHSYSHKFLNYILDPTFKNQIVKNQKVIQKIIHKSPKLFRPPWLFRHPLILRTAESMGMTSISGEFCHELEIFQINPTKIANRTLSKIRPGSIIIFHDGVESRGGNRAQTVEAVKLVVKELKKQNYKFLTIDKILDVSAYDT